MILIGLIAFWFVELSTIPFYIYEYFSEYINKWYLTRLIYKLISCVKCFGFWLGLAIYQDYRAIIVSLVAIVSSKIYSRL